MKINFVTIYLVFVAVLFLLIGCDDPYFETHFGDGFHYKVLDEKNIVVGGLSFQYSKNYVFVPVEIDGYKVTQVGYESGLGFGGNGYLEFKYFKGDKVYELERVYIPNTVEEICSAYMSNARRAKIFYSGKIVNLGKLGINSDSKIYVPSDMYEDFYNVTYESERNILYHANVVYHLNYDIDNPYYYVDYYDYDYETKILYMPPNPKRSGYIFDGWYKDSECSVKWDFENDTLPKLDENEDFLEIKLYAKWISE